MSMGHFLDLNAQALGLFRLPLALAAASLFLGPLVSFLLRKRAPAPRRNARPRRWSLRLSASPRTSACKPSPRCSAPRNSPKPSRRRSTPRRPHRHPPGVRVRLDPRLLPPAPELRLRRTARPSGNPRVPPAAPTPAELAQVDFHPVAVNPIHILTDAELQRHAQLRPQLEPLVRQLLPRRARDLRNAAIARRTNGPARSASSSGRTSPASPARCPRRSRPSTSSPDPAAKRSSATSRTARDILRLLQSSVCRGLLDMIDDEDIDRSFSGFELQPELFLRGGE